jgi:hypothetical protein
VVGDLEVVLPGMCGLCGVMMVGVGYSLVVSIRDISYADMWWVILYPVGVDGEMLRVTACYSSQRESHLHYVSVGGSPSINYHQPGRVAETPWKTSAGFLPEK